MEKEIDSYKFLDYVTRKVMQSWVEIAEPVEMIPWTPLEKPLSECKVAIIGSAAIALKTDEPFDQDGERKNPWWGDPSFRVLPHQTTEKDIGIYHLHIDPSFAYQDLNCLFPLQRLTELETAGVIGAVADQHYSFMGYQIDPTELVTKSAPAMADAMRAEGVDIAILVPS